MLETLYTRTESYWWKVHWLSRTVELSLKCLGFFIESCSLSLRKEANNRCFMSLFLNGGDTWLCQGEWYMTQFYLFIASKTLKIVKIVSSELKLYQGQWYTSKFQLYCIKQIDTSVKVANKLLKFQIPRPAIIVWESIKHRLSRY